VKLKSIKVQKKRCLGKKSISVLCKMILPFDLGCIYKSLSLNIFS